MATQVSTPLLCSVCGHELPEGGRFCIECGHLVSSDGRKLVSSDGRKPSAPPLVPGAGTRESSTSAKLIYPRNPPLSPHLCWLSLLQAGLAQMIFGQVAKGILLVVASLVGLALFPLNLLVAVISGIDAYKVGTALKQGRPVGKWEWFPSA